MQLPNEKPAAALREICSSSRDELSQSERIGRRGTFLIIIEIDKNIAALLLPASDAFCPFLKDLGAIMALVAAARSVPPYIDKSAVRFHGAGAS
jgi:hypothetical protein